MDVENQQIRMDKINKLVESTGLNSILCLHVLRNNNWNQKQSEEYVRLHHDDICNALRYNKYE